MLVIYDDVFPTKKIDIWVGWLGQALSSFQLEFLIFLTLQSPLGCMTHHSMFIPVYFARSAVG